MRARYAVAMLAVLALAPSFAAAQPPLAGLVSYVAPTPPPLGKEAFAVVALTIRANGRVDDAVALSASERSVAGAAEEAVIEWRFERHRELGRGRHAEPAAVVRRELVEFVFQPGGAISSLTHSEGAKAWFPSVADPAVRTLLRSELDASPRLVGPAGGDDVEVVGEATVSYVIDEDGNVRVPIVIASNGDGVAAAALALVRSWRYAPPMHRGARVRVEDRKTITFSR